MDFVTWATNMLTNVWFWLILAGISVFGYGIIRSSPLKKVPIFNNKKTLLMVAIVGFLFASGVFSGLGLGSLSTTPASVGGWSISDVQASTLSASVAGGSVALDANNPYLINARFTDAQANETTAIYEVNSSLFTIYRTGKLVADSCQVDISSPDYLINEVTGQQGSTPYNILEKDATGRYKTYFKSGTTQATTSDAQGKISISFAEGVSSAQFTMLSNVDEESHDALNQYSFRDATINVCGFPETVRIFTM